MLRRDQGISRLFPHPLTSKPEPKPGTYPTKLTPLLKPGQSLRRNRQQILRERRLLPRYPSPPLPSPSLTIQPSPLTLFPHSIRRPRRIPSPSPHLHKSRRRTSRLGRPRCKREADARGLDDVLQQAVQRRRSRSSPYHLLLTRSTSTTQAERREGRAG